MPIRLGHPVEHLEYEGVRHEFVEEIAHGVDEDPPRASPASWPVEALRMKHETFSPAYSGSQGRLLQPKRGLRVSA